MAGRGRPPTAAAILLPAAPARPASAAGAGAAARPARPPVLAAHHAWHHDGDHPTAPRQSWTYEAAKKDPPAIEERRPGEPPPAGGARPPAGPCDGADRAPAERHVRPAQAAGIDAFPADGWADRRGIDGLGTHSTFSPFRAHEHDDLAGRFRRLVSRARGAGRTMLLPVHPGHDNSRFGDDPYVVPGRDGRTLRESLRAATDAGADQVLVAGWNEWPETAAIEPSSSWADPYLYLRVLAEWRGGRFPSPPPPPPPPPAPRRPPAPAAGGRGAPGPVEKRAVPA